MQIVLSDILRTLDLFEINPEDDSETNLSVRYQKYRCLLPPLEDPAGVLDIIYEIIDGLDLMNRRYKLDYVDVPKAMPEMDAIELIDDDNNITYVPLNRIDTHCELRTLFYPKTYGECQAETQKISLPHKPEPDQRELFEKMIDEALTVQNSTMEVMAREYNSVSHNIAYNRKKKRNISYANFDDILALKNTSSDNVQYVMDHVLDHLKLDDSYTISEPSSDDCNMARTIHFVNKNGTIDEQDKELCEVYLPPVRVGRCAPYLPKCLIQF